MRALYRAMLKLYPSEYQAAFGPEMLDVFIEASAHLNRQRPFHRMLFALRECAGLLKGALIEYTAKWASPDTYLTPRCASRRNPDGPGEIAELSAYLESLLRSMEHAIAHHDFPRARYYSNEERITRTQLQRPTT